MTSRPKRTLIAAHDGTPRGVDVVASARRIAHRADARLVIVHVIERQTPYWSRDPDHQHLLRHRLAQVFGSTRAVAGPDAETRAVGARSVGEGLLAAIEDEHAGVVVVGSSHRGPLGHAFYGDVARQLSKQCDCHVHVVPAGAHEVVPAA